MTVPPALSPLSAGGVPALGQGGSRSAQVPLGASLKHLPSGAKGAAAAGGRGRARAISPFFVDFLYDLLSKVLAGQLCLRQKWD